MSPARTRAAHRRASSPSAALEALPPAKVTHARFESERKDLQTVTRAASVRPNEVVHRKEPGNASGTHVGGRHDVTEDVRAALDSEGADEQQLDQPDENVSASDEVLLSRLSSQGSTPRRSRDAKWRSFFPDESSDESDDDNLNIDKIEDLLYLAECRLLEQEKALESFKFSNRRVEPSSQKLMAGTLLPKPYAQSSDKIMRIDASALLPFKTRALADKGRTVDEVITVPKQDQKHGPPPGLTTHFDLPRTRVTPELKRDLQLLSMRAVLNPKRMYKRQGKFKIPEYSQIGTIVEGPTDFHSGRINKKERETSFVKETIKAEQQSGRFKRKYAELQAKQRSGKKGSWNARMAKRRRT